MNFNSKYSDRAGIFLSALCAIHCVFLPIMSITFPILRESELLNDERFHYVMFFLVLLPAMMTFLPHGLRKKDYKALIIPGAALGILFFVNFVFHLHDSVLEVILNLTASLMLIFSHYRHLKSRKCHH